MIVGCDVSTMTTNEKEEDKEDGKNGNDEMKWRLNDTHTWVIVL